MMIERDQPDELRHNTPFQELTALLDHRDKLASERDGLSAQSWLRDTYMLAIRNRQNQIEEFIQLSNPLDGVQQVRQMFDDAVEQVGDMASSGLLSEEQAKIAVEDIENKRADEPVLALESRVAYIFSQTSEDDLSEAYPEIDGTTEIGSKLSGSSIGEDDGMDEINTLVDRRDLYALKLREMTEADLLFQAMGMVVRNAHEEASMLAFDNESSQVALAEREYSFAQSRIRHLVMSGDLTIDQAEAEILRISDLVRTDRALQLANRILRMTAFDSTPGNTDATPTASPVQADNLDSPSDLPDSVTEILPESLTLAGVRIEVSPEDSSRVIINGNEIQLGSSEGETSALMKLLQSVSRHLGVSASSDEAMVYVSEVWKTAFPESKYNTSLMLKFRGILTSSVTNREGNPVVGYVDKRRYSYFYTIPYVDDDKDGAAGTDPSPDVPKPAGESTPTPAGIVTGRNPEAVPKISQFDVVVDRLSNDLTISGVDMRKVLDPEQAIYLEVLHTLSLEDPEATIGVRTLGVKAAQRRENLKVEFELRSGQHRDTMHDLRRTLEAHGLGGHIEVIGTGSATTYRAKVDSYIFTKPEEGLDSLATAEQEKAMVFAGWLVDFVRAHEHESETGGVRSRALPNMVVGALREQGVAMPLDDVTLAIERLLLKEDLRIFNSKGSRHYATNSGSRGHESSSNGSAQGSPNRGETGNERDKPLFADPELESAKAFIDALLRQSPKHFQRGIRVNSFTGVSEGVQPTDIARRLAQAGIVVFVPGSRKNNQQPKIMFRSGRERAIVSQNYDKVVEALTAATAAKGTNILELVTPSRA